MISARVASLLAQSRRPLRGKGVLGRYATTVKNFINGKFEESKASSSPSGLIPVINPATQELVCNVPKSTVEELRRAEEGAYAAYQTWREVPIQQKQVIDNQTPPHYRKMNASLKSDKNILLFVAPCFPIRVEMPPYSSTCTTLHCTVM
jgi:Aldehyde dehydrogenase family